MSEKLYVVEVKFNSKRSRRWMFGAAFTSFLAAHEYAREWRPKRPYLLWRVRPYVRVEASR